MRGVRPNCWEIRASCVAEWGLDPLCSDWLDWLDLIGYGYDEESLSERYERLVWQVLRVRPTYRAQPTDAELGRVRAWFDGGPIVITCEEVVPFILAVEDP